MRTATEARELSERYNFCSMVEDWMNNTLDCLVHQNCQNGFQKLSANLPCGWQKEHRTILKEKLIKLGYRVDFYASSVVTIAW